MKNKVYIILFLSHSPQGQKRIRVFFVSWNLLTPRNFMLIIYRIAKHFFDLATWKVRLKFSFKWKCWCPAFIFFGRSPLSFQALASAIGLCLGLTCYLCLWCPDTLMITIITSHLSLSIYPDDPDHRKQVLLISLSTRLSIGSCFLSAHCAVRKDTRYTEQIPILSTPWKG